MIATYNLYVDWNNDGDFDELGEDVSDDIISATIRRGFSNPLSRVCSVGKATFELSNVSKAYSPPLEADVLPRRPIKFTMTYGGSTVTLFLGFIDNIRPSGGQYGDRRVRFRCTDAMRLLDRFEGEIALQTDTYADDIISAVVSAVYTPPSTNYQAGVNYYVTSAEGWQHEGEQTEEVRASRKIEEACVSDWGKFFLAADGEATFLNRHTMPLDDSAELTLDDAMLDMRYQKSADDVRNHVEVTCYPRTVGTVNEVLSRISQQDAPIIEANDSRDFVLRFDDPVNQEVNVGGKDCVTPVAATDFSCTSDPEGEGDDENSNITVSASFYGDHAKLNLANAAAYPVWIQKLQVRGLAVRAREDVTVFAQSASSIAAYQKSKLPVKATLLSNPDESQLLADHLLDYYKDPLHEVTNVEILANSSSTMMAAVRDLELCDNVTVTESQTGLSSFEGFIYSMRHRIRDRYDHRLMLSLETPYVLAGSPFRLDLSALDSGHVLVY